jgi:predicted secreted Zn-dependent protease
MSINRTHQSACASALAAACLLAAGPAHADWQPTKTVEIVVVAGAGGGTVDYIKADVARAHGVFQDAGWPVK